MAQMRAKVAAAAAATADAVQSGQQCSADADSAAASQEAKPDNRASFSQASAFVDRQILCLLKV